MRRFRLLFMILLIIKLTTAGSLLQADVPRFQSEDGVVTVEVRGSIVNGTALGDVPPELSVTLQMVDATTGTVQWQARSDDGGNFVFTEIPQIDGNTYRVIVDYLERGFVSDAISSAELNAPIDVSIFDLTDDPFAVTIRRVEIDIEPQPMEGLGNGLFITQRIYYTNSSDRAYTRTIDAGEGRFASLLVELPPGALILNDAGSPRYVIVQDEYALVDTSPVLPGDGHRIVALYFLPYDDKGAIIESTLFNALSGDVEVRAAPSRLRVIADGLENSGTVIADDREYVVYSGALDIPEGEVFGFELSGKASDDTAMVESGDLSSIMLPALAVIVTLGLVILMFSMMGKDRRTREIDRLVRQIAQLDEMHEQGRINHDVYRRQRQEYRERLDALVSDEN